MTFRALGRDWSSIERHGIINKDTLILEDLINIRIILGAVATLEDSETERGANH